MSRPSKFIRNIIRICSPKDRPDIPGDMEEMFRERLEKKGQLLTHLTILWDCLSIVRLTILSRKRKKGLKTQIIMKTNFKIAGRILLKQKIYTSINAIGLAVGLTVCFFILLFVKNETIYYHHFKHHNKIYRITGEYNQGGDSRVHSASSTFLLKPFIEKNIETGTITRIKFRNALVKISRNRSFMEDQIIEADSTFFKVFTFRFIAGSPENALTDPDKAILTRSTAKKFFPDRDPLGKSIEMAGKNFIVSHIIEDIPTNTHFQGDLIIPIHGIQDLYPQWVKKNPSGTSHYTYLKTSAEKHPDYFAESLNEFIAGIWDFDSDPPVYSIQSITDIHLHSDLQDEIQKNGDILTVYIFLSAAIGILLLALINYINLSMAGSFGRLREVGIKKVLGASRSNQVFQFQSESILTGLLGSFLAVAFVHFGLPYFLGLTGISIDRGLLLYINVFLVFFGVTVLVSLLTGSFPALFLLKIPVITSLRGSYLQSTDRSGFTVRNGLVLFQFFLAAILIFATLVIQQQIHFIQNKDLGLDSKNVIVVPFQGETMRKQYDVFKKELLKEPHILNVTASNNKVTNRVSHWRGYQVGNTDEKTSSPTVIVGHDFFETMGIDLVKGRSFSMEFPSDISEAYVINESAARFFDLDEPVGTPLKGMAFTGSKWSEKKARIIGVVEDFHFASLHDEIKPTVFSLSSEITTPLNWIEIKLSKNNLKSALMAVDKTWNKFSQDTPFYYEFMSDEISKAYRKDDRFLKVVSTFSFLTIFIGCIGLFGLTAFMLKKRKKEIGIRKILGARSHNLFALLSRQFIFLVVLANLLGWPIAVWLSTSWLQNFAYRIEIPIWIYFYTVIGSVCIAILSILYHVVRVSTDNPVKSIRVE